MFNHKTNPQKASLQRLKNVLLQSKSDIHVLVNQLGLTRGFSEDAQKSSLHKLIRKLIQLTKFQHLKSIANDCLGIIGPIELKTTVLHCEQVLEAKEAMIKSLMEFIGDSRTHVSNAALDAIKIVLASKDFKNVKISDERLFPFQHVFHHQSSKNPVLTLNFTHLDQSWWPSLISHDKWICKLVTNLLKCYPKVKDCYLSKGSMYGLHLLPIAEVPEFCQQIFPGLVHDLLLHSGPDKLPIGHVRHQHFCTKTDR